MSRHLFAVAFRALQDSTRTAHFSVEFYHGRSEKDAIRICMDSFQKTLTQADGWSHWSVLAKRVDPEWITIVQREADWFDQSFARRLYAIGVYAANLSQDKGAILVGCALTYNDGCAHDKLLEFAQQHCPEADGWTISATDFVEWTECARRYPTPRIEWVPRGTTTH